MNRPIEVESFLTVSSVLRDPAFSTFDLAEHLRGINQYTPTDLTPLVHSAENNPFFLEGPRLRMLHLLVGRLLAPSRMPLWQPIVANTVEHFLDRLPTLKSVDLVRDFVDPTFRTVMGAVLGFDSTDAQQFTRWSRQARDFLEPLLSLRRLAKLRETLLEIHAHLDRTAFRAPTDGPESVSAELLQHLSLDFTRDDATALVAVMMIVGQATPATLANCILYMLRLPAAARESAVGANASAWVAENLELVLRLSSAIQAIGRVALEPRSTGGQQFSAGQMLHLNVPAANQDEITFPMQAGCPAARRSSSADHLVFGSGRHACPGAALARLIIGTALSRLFTRFPQLALVTDPQWDRSTFLSYATTLPCKL